MQAVGLLLLDDRKKRGVALCKDLGPVLVQMVRAGRRVGRGAGGGREGEVREVIEEMVLKGVVGKEEAEGWLRGLDALEEEGEEGKGVREGGKGIK